MNEPHIEMAVWEPKDQSPPAWLAYGLLVAFVGLIAGFIALGCAIL